MSHPSSPRASHRLVWPLTLALAVAAALGQAAGWKLGHPALVAAAALASLGLLLCLVLLRRRHLLQAEEVRRADDRARRAESAQLAAAAQHRQERARLEEQQAAVARERTQTLHHELEAWHGRLRAVLDRQEQKQEQEQQPQSPPAAQPGTQPGTQPVPQSAAQPGSRPGAQAAPTGRTPLEERTARLLDDALEEIAEELLDTEDACTHAMVFLAQRLQAGALQIQRSADALAQRPEEGLLELGLRTDHEATTLSHHAQSLRIMGGEWVGQQWQRTVALSEVVQSAVGRIVDYPRVEVSGDPDVGVRHFAAEWVIHLVAELLSNATTSSPASKKVSVQLEAVPSGAVIQIDDRGTGMTESTLAHARELVSGHRTITLRDLETPQIGLAVVGNIARRYELEVSLGRSPYGGVRAVVLVPQDLLEAVAPVSESARARLAQAGGTVSAITPAAPLAAAPGTRTQAPTGLRTAAAVRHDTAADTVTGTVTGTAADTTAGAPAGTRRARPRPAATGPAATEPARAATEPTPMPTATTTGTGPADATTTATTTTATATATEERVTTRSGLPRRRSPRHDHPTGTTHRLTARRTPTTADAAVQDTPEAAAAFMSSFLRPRKPDAAPELPLGDEQ